MAAPVLELSNATVVKDERPVLDGLTLTIAADEHTAILGPNGAGKSALVRVLTHEDRPLAREQGPPPVRVFGNDNWDVFDLRSQLGHPHELSDGQASADNIVVLVLEYGTNPDGVPEAQTVGSGVAVVYSNGLKTEGTWTRQSPTDPVTLAANGQPILLVTGRTWVELVDDQHNLTDG